MGRKKIYKKQRPLIVHILTTLNLCGVFSWRNNTSGFFDTKKKMFRKAHDQLNGVSDILGIFPDGKFLAIEIKTVNDKLSIEQLDFLENIKKKNGISIVARSVDDVLKVLQEENYIEWDGYQIKKKY